MRPEPEPPPAPAGEKGGKEKEEEEEEALVALRKESGLTMLIKRGRLKAGGAVSATFAASLVTSPTVGAYLSASHGDNLVVLVATLVAVVDICFILLAVPESLPEKK